MIKALKDIWDMKSEIAQAWELLAQETGLDEELSEPVNTLADALEQITIADLLQRFPGGFAVGPMAGLYQILKPADYNQYTGVGTLIVKKLLETVDDDTDDQD